MRKLCDVVIWGASGHAKVVADILRTSDAGNLAGFLDDSDLTRRGEAFCGAQILGGADELRVLRSTGISHAIIAFGDNARRLQAARRLETEGFSLVRAIHPAAIIASDVTIGEGTMVAAGAVINSSARIGRHVIVNTNASIDHDCVLEDGAQVSPGANLAGNVKIGACATIGLGAVVIEKLTVGANSFVGAGAVVIEDVPANVVVVGVPATIRKYITVPQP